VLGGSAGAQSLPAPAGALLNSNDDLLGRDFEWPAGTIQEQLDRDDTLVPFGKGSVFVPAITNPLDEPPVVVNQNGQKVAEGTTGARIILPPGSYDVRVGTGAVEQRIRIQVSVREGHTAVVPVSWAALSVHVVDEQYGSLRASYELIRVEDREYMGVGFGTDEQAGEPVTTWILRPGLYKLVRLGDNYRARRDFATVRLLEARHTHFLLVLNGETAALAGGGEVPKEELFRPQDEFYGSLVLGGDAAMNARTAVLGVPDSVGFTLRAFLDARMSVKLLGSPLVLQLQVEQGQTKTPDLPWAKTNDRIDLDALYVYRLYPWIGPYLRLGAETNLLSGRQVFLDPTAVIRCGEETEPQILDSFQLSPPLGLATMKEGAGINLRVFKSLFAESTVRTGLGARHRIARNLYAPLSSRPDGCPEAASYFEAIPTTNQIGIETTVLTVARITRWVVANLEIDSLVPFSGFDQTVLELEASVAIKLTSYVSLNYVVRFLRDRALFERDRLQQDVLLRFSLEVL